MDNSKLRPRKSQAFKVVRCSACGTEVVVDKARGAICPKCGTVRETPPPAVAPPVEHLPAHPSLADMEPVPPVEKSDQTPSRRIQSWRPPNSDAGRGNSRHAPRPYNDSRGKRPVERGGRSDDRTRSVRPPDRPTERGFDRRPGHGGERNFERSPDRPPFRSPDRRPGRPPDRGFSRDRNSDHPGFAARGMGRTQGPRGDRRPPAIDVPMETRRQVLTAWEALRQTEERPPEGRRMHLASQFGLSFEQVTAIIKSQPRTREAPPPPRPRPPDPLDAMDTATRRIVGFEIEKAYFAELQSSGEKRPWKVVVKAVARLVRRPEASVATWLQMLHRKSKRMIRAQRPDEATTARIMEAYQAYLQADKPPEVSLHKKLSADLGAKQRQVHRVLYEYRWQLRNKAISGPPMIIPEPPVPEPPAKEKELTES